MADPLVYVVIVNYGNACDTLACLSSLHVLTGATIKVIVVENGSPDDSAAVLEGRLATDLAQDEGGSHQWTEHWDDSRTRYYPLKLIISRDNLGFAGGCNAGIRKAMTDADTGYVWLLNNDTIVDEDALSALITRMKADATLGLCGSTLTYFDRPSVVQACGGQFNAFLGRGGPIGVGRDVNGLPHRRDVERRMDYVVGASMLATRSFIETVGMMDERYFLYFEELDWALRGKRHGFRLGWAPSSFVLHKEGAATGSSATKRPSDFSLHYMTSSYLRFVAKYRRWFLPAATARMVLNIAKWRLRGDKLAARAVRRGIEAATQKT